MTRDYAKNGKASNRKSKPRSQVNRRKSTKNSNGAGGVFWFVSGVAVGALLTSLILVPMVGDDSGAEPGESQAQNAEPANDNRPQFDFYKLLSESEVVVIDEEPEQSAPQAATNNNQPAAPESIYFLQAGSFKNSGDADSLRAQLLLMNLDAAIEKAKSSSGDNWYRVIAGPFESRGEMTQARSKLASNGVQTLVLKRKNSAR